MLSAEVTSKGRTIPIYRQVFKEGELKVQMPSFLSTLRRCIPEGHEVIIVMDAGFYCNWFKAIESFGWYWVSRLRQGKSFKLSGQDSWTSVKDFSTQVKEKTTDHGQIALTKKDDHPCRLITKKQLPKGRKVKGSRGKITGKGGSGMYQKAAKEPWHLVTNLPRQYKGAEIIKIYAKRMQIEVSFRDIKSHQFGLCARHVRTKCVHRWGVKMLLAAIVHITYWVIGVIGHSQGMQRAFQANTVKDKKVFSYFTLGKLIIDHNKIEALQYNQQNIVDVIQNELNRKW